MSFKFKHVTKLSPSSFLVCSMHDPCVSITVLVLVPFVSCNAGWSPGPICRPAAVDANHGSFWHDESTTIAGNLTNPSTSSPVSSPFSTRLLSTLFLRPENSNRREQRKNPHSTPVLHTHAHTREQARRSWETSGTSQVALSCTRRQLDRSWGRRQPWWWS